MRKTRQFFIDLWSIAGPYLGSEEWMSAWALLGALILLSVAQVGFGLLISFSQSIFYTALQQKDPNGFFRGLFWFTPRPGGLPMPPFVVLAIINIGAYSLATFLQSWLQIRWQRWTTVRLVRAWLDGHAHLKLALTASPDAPGADNPDQRIEQDVGDVTRSAISLSIGLLTAVSTSFGYGGLLWSLSGPFAIGGVRIPGYLLWCALIYALVLTGLTHLVGHRLAGLDFLQQRFRGDFRFSLVRIRENGEAIAMSGGETEEERGLAVRFNAIYSNFMRIIRRTAMVGFMGSTFEQASIVFPTAIAAPRFFAGAISFGTLNQIRLGFLQLSEATLWFVTSYADLAAFVAQVERLSTFERSLSVARGTVGDVQATFPDAGGDVTGTLSITTPDGRILLSDWLFRLPAGHRTAIVGASGSGKSTLFRTLAGVWPFAAGEMVGPPPGSMFLPQRPYLPEGTLRRVLCYPNAPDAMADWTLRSALDAVGLGRLAARLDDDTPWWRQLSPGEQQRLTIARALLEAPPWLFLDEATASLDTSAETELHEVIRRTLPNTTLISITHREALAKNHDQVLSIARHWAEEKRVDRSWSALSC